MGDRLRDIRRQVAVKKEEEAMEATEAIDGIYENKGQYINYFNNTLL